MATEFMSYNLQLILVFSLFLLLLLYAPDHYIGTRRRTYLPGPTGWPLVGNSFSIFLNRKRMLMHFHDLATKFGELHSITLPGWGRAIIINHPQWIQHMKKGDITRYGKGPAALAIFAEFPGDRSAFGSEGATWRLSRKLMQPIFTTKSLDTHISWSMGVVLPTARELLTTASRENVQIDWNGFSGRIALDIFCKMALGMEFELLTNDLKCLSMKHPLVDAPLVMNNISSERLFNPLWRFTEKFDGRGYLFNEARREFLNAIDAVVTKRRDELRTGAATESDDFLSALLSQPGCNDPLLIRDTLITLFFATRDNTQNSFTWALYELSHNPEWLRRMREEAISHGPKGGEVISLSDMQSFPIHMAIFYETLRLWPGVPKNARQALEDDMLPAIPEHDLPSVKVHKGDYLLWSDWSIARNTTIWGEDAGVFNPGRFLSSDGSFERPVAPKFHSFGFGARYCPGAQLAAYEFVALFAYILPYFELSPVEMKCRTVRDGLTLGMEGSFMVYVRSRCKQQQALLDEQGKYFVLFS